MIFKPSRDIYILDVDDNKMIKFDFLPILSNRMSVHDYVKGNLNYQLA